MSVSVLQGKVVERLGLAAAKRRLDDLWQLSLGQPRKDRGKRLIQRVGAVLSRDPFERVVPQRHDAGAIDDRHSFVQRFDHLPMAMLLGQPTGVDLIGAVSQVDRDDGERQKAPELLDQHGGKHRTGHGSDEVVRCTPQKVLLPDTLDWLRRGQRHDQCDQAAVHEKVGDDCGHQRRYRARPGELARRSTEEPIDRSRRFDRDDEAGHVEERAMERVAARPAEGRLTDRAGRGDGHRGVCP